MAQKSTGSTPGPHPLLQCFSLARPQLSNPPYIKLTLLASLLDLNDRFMLSILAHYLQTDVEGDWYDVVEENEPGDGHQDTLLSTGVVGFAHVPG